MTRQKTKAKENKITEFIVLSMFGFCIVTTLLDSISIEPSLTSVYFYILLLVVIFSIYKPFRIFLMKRFSILFKLIFKKYLNKPILEISKIDQMNGQEFEIYLKSMFEKYGYIVKLTKQSRDYGADLILHKGTKKYVVQAKRYNENVGIKAVQDVIGAIKYYKVDGAIIVTNRYFSTSAVNLSKSNKVLLIDRDELMQMNYLSKRKLKFVSAISFILNK